MHHASEREKKTHTHTEREREKSVETVSIALSQERRNEREKTKSGLEKTASKQRKRNERDLREKNKSKEELKRRYIKRTVFSSESSSLSLFFFEKRWRLGVKTRWFDDVLRARTMARKRRKRSELPCSLGFRTLNHSIRKSLVKAVGNAKEEHTRILGESERAFHF